MLVLERIPAALAAPITEALSIPTIGIKAGSHGSGQVLVLYDVLGLTQGPRPKFVPSYIDGFDLLQQGLLHWAKDVRSAALPSTAESHALPEAARHPGQVDNTDNQLSAKERALMKTTNATKSYLPTRTGTISAVSPKVNRRRGETPIAAHTTQSPHSAIAQVML